VLVFHALHSNFDDDILSSWWAMMTEVLQKHRRGSAKLILLGDANAKLGSVQSPWVGRWKPVQQSLGGTLFHQLMRAHNVFAANTFDVCSTGEESATWFFEEGRGNRIDYVGVDASIPYSAVSTEVLSSFDMLSPARDHLPVLANIMFSATGGEVYTRRRSPGCDSEKFNDPIAVAAFINDLEQVRAPAHDLSSSTKVTVVVESVR